MTPHLTLGSLWLTDQWWKLTAVMVAWTNYFDEWIWKAILIQSGFASDMIENDHTPAGQTSTLVRKLYHHLLVGVSWVISRLHITTHLLTNQTVKMSSWQIIAMWAWCAWIEGQNWKIQCEFPLGKMGSCYVKKLFHMDRAIPINCQGAHFAEV